MCGRDGTLTPPWLHSHLPVKDSHWLILTSGQPMGKPWKQQKVGSWVDCIDSQKCRRVTKVPENGPWSPKIHFSNEETETRRDS